MTKEQKLPPMLAGLLERSQGLPEGTASGGLPKPTGTLVRATNRFERACEERAFKGTRHPEDHAEIEEEYQRAKKALYGAALTEAGRHMKGWRT